MLYLSFQTCIQKFRRCLDMAPVLVGLDEENEGPYMKAMACAYTNDKATPSFFVVLDSNGEAV